MLACYLLVDFNTCLLLTTFDSIDLTDLHELLIENLHHFVLESIDRFFPLFLIFFCFPLPNAKCIVNMLLQFISTYNISFFMMNFFLSWKYEYILLC